MADSVGSFVVRLGLDAADYTAGLTKAEQQAYNFGHSIGTGIRNAAGVAAAALSALGISAGGAVAGFNALIEGAGKFADLADKTGASAEALASFAVAAGTSGVSMDKIASATNTMAKNLVGVTDESKAAGAALKAIGINVKEFKALAPEAQIEKLSTTFAQFEDGAGKSAAAMAILGKSGADVLPFLKTMEEQGGRQVILTQEMIDTADAYADMQAKAKAELELYAQALATQAIPMITAFTGAVTDTIKEVLGLSNGTTDLKNNTAVADFAENAVRVLGFVIDAADGVIRVFQGVGTAIGAAAAAAGAILSGDISAAKNIVGEGIADIDKILQREQFSAKLNRRIEEAKKNAATVTAPQGTRPQVAYNGPTRRSKGNNKAAQEAKAQLASDLDDIKNAQDALVGQYRNAERILQAERSAGLKDESAYYEEKVRLLNMTTAAQEDGLRKTIDRLQQEKLTGKDAIDNARKIADAQAKLQKVQDDAATSAKVAAIEHEAALKRIDAALLSARQAAQDYFDTTARGYAREIAGTGQGQKARDYAAAIQQIEDRYQQQRQQLQNQRAQAEMQGQFGPDAQKQYNKQLEIINEFQSKSIDSYTSYYEKLQALQKDWAAGASEALANYADEAANVAAHTQETVSNAFKGLEDQLVNLFTGKKFDAKALIESITADMARALVKEKITGPLAGWLKDSLGFDASGILGGGGGSTGMAALGTSSVAAATSLSGLTAAATSASAALGSLSFTGASSGSGDVLGDLLNNLGLTGARASGGLVRAGGLYRVNENGPEILDYQGRQYLMTGGAGRVIANNKVSGGGGFRQNVNIVVEGTPHRETLNQIARRTNREIVSAARRFA